MDTNKVPLRCRLRRLENWKSFWKKWRIAALRLEMRICRTPWSTPLWHGINWEISHDNRTDRASCGKLDDSLIWKWRETTCNAPLKNDTSGVEDVTKKKKLIASPIIVTTTKNQGPFSHWEFSMQFVVNKAAENLKQSKCIHTYMCVCDVCVCVCVGVCVCVCVCVVVPNRKPDHTGSNQPYSSVVLILTAGVRFPVAEHSSRISLSPRCRDVHMVKISWFFFGGQCSNYYNNF